MAEPVESGDYTSETDAKTTWELLSSDDRSLRTALQWRLALPLMVFIGTVLAIPLSRTNSRQGRFLKIFPALIIFFLYYTFLGGVSSAMNNGKWPILPGLWVVHIAFAGVAFLLFNWDSFRLRHRQRKQEK
jgi:lipopolysaccharide export system permease protein